MHRHGLRFEQQPVPYGEPVFANAPRYGTFQGQAATASPIVRKDKGGILRGMTMKTLHAAARAAPSAASTEPKPRTSIRKPPARTRTTQKCRGKAEGTNRSRLRWPRANATATNPLAIHNVQMDRPRGLYLFWYTSIVSGRETRPENSRGVRAAGPTCQGRRTSTLGGALILSPSFCENRDRVV